MDLREGALVANNVRLVRQLGRGGMGSVWVGEHLGLGTEVAVKFIMPELAHRDPSVVARFRQEANAAAKISSPHVVRVFDFGQMVDGTSYLVMELLQGNSLRQWLDLEKRLDLRRTGLVVAQAARALEAAHAMGIVHRDIKPDNLFLIDSPYQVFVKVLDFGIAKQSGRGLGGALTQTGMIMGTPEYMSPELLLSTKDATPHADLWALAVVAYECLVGSPPFRAETAAALGIVLDRSQYELPSHARPGLPPALDTWFARAFARFPDNRFATAAELAKSFVGVAKRHAIETEPTAEAGPGWDELDGEPDVVCNAPTPRRPPGASATTGLSATQREIAAGPPMSGGADSGLAGPTTRWVPSSTGVAGAISHGPATADPHAPTLASAHAWGSRQQPSTLIGVEGQAGHRRSGLRAGLGAVLTAIVATGAIGVWVALQDGSDRALGSVGSEGPTSPPSASSIASAEPTVLHTDPNAPASATAAEPAPSAVPPQSTAPSPSATPRVKTKKPPPKAGKPSYCNPTDGYYRDRDGTLQIKPECIPYL